MSIDGTISTNTSMSMKAAIYDSFGGPIQIQTVSIPPVPTDGVLLKVMATGVCRSDWHGWKGHDSDIAQHGLPFCPGHEFSGVVVQTGPSTNLFQPGHRVAVPFILSCGSCVRCHSDEPTVCTNQEQPGFTRWGSFAEFVAVPRADRNLRHLPDNVSFVQAAALGCRFTTAYRAVVQRGDLRRGQSVAVFGCGGLGLSCVLLARHVQSSGTATSEAFKGCIIAVDVSRHALEKARELGATHTVLLHKSDSSTKEEETPQQIAKRIAQHTPYNEGADLTIDAGGFASTSRSALYATRPGGKMVQVGLPHGDTPVPMGMVAGRELSILGSHGFDANDLPDLLQLVAAGGVLDPLRLVEREVTLEEGCRSLRDMDTTSPLGILVITKFDENIVTSCRL